MTPERWRQIADLFEGALRREEGARAAFLAEACAGDAELRREVEAMLTSHERAGDFIEEPALAVAARQGGSEESLAGQMVAHYQVLSLLGAGGMGDVYLALDTRLGRRVALKLLPDYFTGDERRAQLFVKEARAASALNHPNIVTVYEIGQWEGRYYMAMEHLEGETLGAHLHRGQTPLPKLLRYLQQVAEGLTKAHAAGVVHRDLKPDNIMVTRDGYAKVLDFGLAKLTGWRTADRGWRNEEAETLMQPLPNSPPSAIRHPPSTMPGMVMGTAGYMSPEQAQGRVREIDHRSDIFSFGCILYEAATGRQAFAGADVLDSLHKIVHAPAPQVREVSPHVPAALDRIVRRCLAKDPERRYQAIKDVALELEELRQELLEQPGQPRPARKRSGAATARGAPPAAATAELTARPTGSAGSPAGGLQRHQTAALLIAAALVIAAGSLGLLFFFARQFYLGRQPAAESAPVAFGQMKLARLTTTGRASDAALSPDGKYVAYLNIEARGGLARGGGTASIWLRQVATSRDIMIVEPGQFILRGLTFSPDSNYLYFRAQEAGQSSSWVYRIPVLGGDAQRLIKASFSRVGFSPDGRRVAFVRNHSPVAGESHVLVANADGTNERIVATRGPAELFATPDRPTAPAWSPDGRVLVCALQSVSSGSFTLLEVPLEGGAERQIGDGRWSNIDAVAWLPDGSGLMLTARDHSSPQMQIWRVAYPSGEAHRVTNDLNEYQGMSLSADAGALAVVESARETHLWLMPTGRPAEARAVTSGTGKADGHWGISWTPDGKLVYGSNASGNRDIWLLDPARGTQTQLTRDARQNFYPRVTPDGRSILFFSDRGEAFGIWQMDMDGGHQRQVLAANMLRFDCSPDGQWIVYSGLGSRGVPALWRARSDGSEPIELGGQHWEELPSISPDGREVAFQYFGLGAGGMNVGRMPLAGGPMTKVAEAPFRLNPTIRWTPDGSAIAYIDNRGEAGQIYALPVEGGPPRKLTDFKADAIFWFDWSRDGKQLALARGTTTSDVILISNFR